MSSRISTFTDCQPDKFRQRLPFRLIFRHTAQKLDIPIPEGATMPEEPARRPSYLSSRQLFIAMTALSLHAGINGAVPLLAPHRADQATERAVERIGDELASIRSSLVSTQIEMTKALAAAMQELSDHSRRLEKLEDHQRR